MLCGKRVLLFVWRVTGVIYTHPEGLVMKLMFSFHLRLSVNEIACYFWMWKNTLSEAKNRARLYIEHTSNFWLIDPCDLICLSPSHIVPLVNPHSFMQFIITRNLLDEYCILHLNTGLNSWYAGLDVASAMNKRHF